MLTKEKTAVKHPDIKRILTALSAVTEEIRKTKKMVNVCPEAFEMKASVCSRQGLE